MCVVCLLWTHQCDGEPLLQFSWVRHRESNRGGSGPDHSQLALHALGIPHHAHTIQRQTNTPTYNYTHTDTHGSRNMWSAITLGTGMLIKACLSLPPLVSLSLSFSLPLSLFCLCVCRYQSPGHPPLSSSPFRLPLLRRCRSSPSTPVSLSLSLVYPDVADAEDAADPDPDPDEASVSTAVSCVCVCVNMRCVCAVCELVWQISQLILPLLPHSKKERESRPPLSLCLSLSQLQSLSTSLHSASLSLSLLRQ